MARNALGLEFGSAAQLSKRPGSVWNCLWGNALKRSPGINRKSRVTYPGPGFHEWFGLQSYPFIENYYLIKGVYSRPHLSIYDIFYTLENTRSFNARATHFN